MSETDDLLFGDDPEEALPEPPPVVPSSPQRSSLFESFAPPGAEAWRTTHDEDGNEREPEEEWSEEAKELLQIIDKALGTDRVTEIHGYGPNKFGLKLDGKNVLLVGKRFRDLAEYIRFMRFIVDIAQGATAWRDIERHRMGVLSMRSGERLTIFLPTASPWPTMSIRKHTSQNWSPMDFVDKGTMTKEMMLFLQTCVAAKVNMLIVGLMGSGKTSLLRALAQENFGDNERIAVVEQVPELHLTKPLAIQYLYQPTVEGLGLHDILDHMLYNSIQRLLVGEVHLDGLTKMLEVMILSEGSMSTYHAMSVDQAGARMTVGLQQENANMTADTAVSYIRQAVELVVVLDIVDGEHRCVEIGEIDWRATGQPRLTSRTLFEWHREEERFKSEQPPDQDGRLVRKIKHKYQMELPHTWFVNPEDLEEYTRRMKK